MMRGRGGGRGEEVSRGALRAEPGRINLTATNRDLILDLVIRLQRAEEHDSSSALKPPPPPPPPVDVKEEARAGRLREALAAEKAERHKHRILKKMTRADRKAAAAAEGAEGKATTQTTAVPRAEEVLPLRANVRIQLATEANPKRSKLVVLARADDLKELLKSAKNKHNLKKRPVAAFLGGGDAVYLRDTRTLPDDSLVIVSNKVVPTAPQQQHQKVDGEEKGEDEEEEGGEPGAAAIDTATDGDKSSNGSDCLDTTVTAMRAAFDRRNRRMHRSQTLSPEEVSSESARLTARAEELLQSGPTEAEQRLQAQRQRLPAWQQREEIVRVVHENSVVVISGATGCGKTTQVPQFILDDAVASGAGGACNIICTQPRRISAIGVAERVAEERSERIGSTVGYQIRLESRLDRLQTRLAFCTTGILLRRLQADRDLLGVTHVIVDEVHERSVMSDFLLIILRDLLRRRPAGLKVILMSATLDAELFSRYFGGCPCIDIPGLSFPVTDLYLEDAIEATGYNVPEHSNSRDAGRAGKVRDRTNAADGDRDDATDDTPPRPRPLSARTWQAVGRAEATARALAESGNLSSPPSIDYQLVAAVVRHICRTSSDDGAILVFLPGLAEIQRTHDALRGSAEFGDPNRYRVICLHSSIPSAQQRRVFDRAPAGCRKIVIATNIAETSITIDDVVYVVDSGRVKEMRYDATRGMSCLTECWCARASSKQRRGRAGRVQNGVCYHLFSRGFASDFMPEFQLPEIQRVPLAELVLQAMMLDAGNPAQFIRRALQPPSGAALGAAVRALIDAEAIVQVDRDNRSLTKAEFTLTPLGFHLAQLPVDVRIGKMLVFAAIFQCLDPALTIAAALSYKSPFVSPMGKQDAARARKTAFAEQEAHSRSGDGRRSDHLAMLAAYNGWQEARRRGGAGAAWKFCRDNFLSQPALDMISHMRRQYLELLQASGFVIRQRRRREGGGGGGKRDDDVGGDVGDGVNRLANNRGILKCVMCAGLYPNIIRMSKPERGSSRTVVRRIEFACKSELVSIHPGSVNFRSGSGGSGEGSEFGSTREGWLLYHSKVETSRVFVHDTTFISPYALLLFGGDITVDHRTRCITLDEWIRFKAKPETAVLFKLLRRRLDRMLLMKIDNPETDLRQGNAGLVLEAVTQLLGAEEETDG